MKHKHEHTARVFKPVPWVERDEKYDNKQPSSGCSCSIGGREDEELRPYYKTLAHAYFHIYSNAHIVPQHRNRNQQIPES
jgi:hypothetical protein